MAVQDPTFWKRFSIAVHQDDAAKQEMAQHAGLNHSYVISLAEMPSPGATRPTSPAHMLSSSHPRPLSPVVLSPLSPTATQAPSSPSSTAHMKKAHSTPFARHGNGSQLTLGFSGRPPSRFKFWTSVTADPTNRDSWLEGQRRKRRHRAWVCWAFWISLLLLVGGVVAAVLVLKSKGIIKM
ncbi:hypothetical protein P171DRAFT_489964 [Karstenula rhodostoma CBS 690.94]|uniref:Uncharacterized protein n=1 Tax=Karstenula rhodostoma CBS 690.94 TaxID=1392251 RepID=A0A9P4U8H3_9PLEO|nr:hypothetical protein P171DRAFT_489964 [Karstenula rhodostoma CBS 690.94]